MPFNNSQVDELKLFFHYLQISSPDDEVELISLAAMISDAFWRKCWRWWQSWKIRIYYFRSMGFVWAIRKDWLLESGNQAGHQEELPRMCCATSELLIEVQRPALKINWGPPTANLWPGWSPQKRINRDKLYPRQKMRKSHFNHQFCSKACFNHQYCTKINYFFIIQCSIQGFVAMIYIYKGSAYLPHYHIIIWANENTELL